MATSNSLTPSERAMRARIAADTRWATEPDRAKATTAARSGLRRKFENQIDPTGSMSPAELDRRVNSMMRAHMNRMSLAAAKARRLKKTGGNDAA